MPRPVVPGLSTGFVGQGVQPTPEGATAATSMACRQGGQTGQVRTWSTGLWVACPVARPIVDFKCFTVWGGCAQTHQQLVSPWGGETAGLEDAGGVRVCENVISDGCGRGVMRRKFFVSSGRNPKKVRGGKIKGTPRRSKGSKMLLVLWNGELQR